MSLLEWMKIHLDENLLAVSQSFRRIVWKKEAINRVGRLTREFAT